MPNRFFLRAVLACCLFLLSLSAQEETLEGPGLIRPATTRVDSHGRVHVEAQTEEDAVFALGFLHARNRLFQMDLLRRTFAGTLAEIMGYPAIDSDIQFRVLGLQRAAERSWQASPPEIWSLIFAYTAGVNAYLNSDSFSLPPEYAALEMDRDGIRAWTAMDSMVIIKGLAFSMAFDLGDLERTQQLEAFVAAGEAAGFDGEALLFEDVLRSAPFLNAISIGGKNRTVQPQGARPKSQLPAYLRGKHMQLVQQAVEKFRKVPMLKAALERRWDERGSNWWLIGGQHSDTGSPLMANDPHLALTNPALFFEAHLSYRLPDRQVNAFGVTVPGTPAIIQGCNDYYCWGSTINPLDTTDIYAEELVTLIGLGLPIGTIFDGKQELLVSYFENYYFNILGDGQNNNLVKADIGLDGGGVVLTVPRHMNAPIVAIDISDPSKPIGISIQFTGWGPTQETQAILAFMRGQNLDDFKQGLVHWDSGSQNWAYADRTGNIAYFTADELPLREDLQLEGTADGGVPPWIMRDGSHNLKHEWLSMDGATPANQSTPFAILPFTEMPQVENPTSGWIVNANNDPIGTTLDNNPLSFTRESGGVLYLNPGYAIGLRAGRIEQMIEEKLGGGEGKISLADMAEIQADHHMIEGQKMIPFILTAQLNGSAEGADPTLAALASDGAVAEAVGRLASWDLDTPTGIQQGYDAGDDPDNLPAPSQEEVNASVATTIYSLWRSRMIANTVDAVLAQYGLTAYKPDSDRTLLAVHHLLSQFEQQQGVGRSGLFFFPGHEDVTAATARDITILKSLKEALDLLAGDAFKDAFNNSTDQNDYRWGMLHRLVLDHQLGESFSIPSTGGLSHLSENLHGIARPGTVGTVDVAAHSTRADDQNDFTYGSGSVRRFLGDLAPDGIQAYQIIPGGASAFPDSTHYADSLKLWLVNQHIAYPENDPIYESQSDLVLPAAKRLLPHLTAEGGGFNTELLFFNATTIDMEANLTAYQADGTPGIAATRTVAAGSIYQEDAASLTAASGLDAPSHLVIESGSQLWVTSGFKEDLPQGDVGTAHSLESQDMRRTFVIYPGESNLVFDGMAVVNQGPWEAQIMVSALDSYGAVLDSKEWAEALPPLGKQTGLFDQLFPDLQPSAIRIDASQPLSTLFLRGSWPGSEPSLLFTNPPTPPPPWTEAIPAGQVIPHLTSPTGGFATKLIFQNLGITAETIALQPYQTDGTPLPLVSLTIEAGQTLEQDQDELLTGAQASHMSISGNASTSVSAAYKAISAQGASAHVHATHAADTMYAVYAESAAGFFDGLAAVNMGPEPAVITAVALDADGIELAREVLVESLPSLAKQLALFSSTWPALSPTMIRIESSQPIAVLFLRGTLNSDPSFLFVNPAIPLDSTE